MTDESIRKPPTRGQAMQRVQMSLRSLARELHRLNDAVGSHVDLLPGDLEVLDVIAREGPTSPRQVVAATGIHPATLTGILDRLEKGRWLQRRPDPDDRRRVIVQAITERGGELAGLYAPMTKALNQICSGYSPEQLAVIVDFLERAAAAGTTAAAKVRDQKDDA